MSSTMGRLDLISSGAEFSSDRRYRYTLWRAWGLGQRACFILLNPSTADESTNDPTIERCERRARMWGYAGLEVLNVFAFRSTDPAGLLRVDDPVGPDNDSAIGRVAGSSAVVICGWGGHGTLLGRGRAVLNLLSGTPLYALRINAATGEPGHPLYLPYSAMPQPYGPGAPPWERPDPVGSVEKS